MFTRRFGTERKDGESLASSNVRPKRHIGMGVKTPLAKDTQREGEDGNGVFPQDSYAASCWQCQ